MLHHGHRSQNIGSALDGVAEDKIEKVTPPKKRSVDRQAYSPAIIDLLRDAQESLRDQIGIQLRRRLGSPS